MARMTREEYLTILGELNLTPASNETAAALGLSVRQLKRIAAGVAPVPGPIARLLAVYRFHGIPDRVLRP